MDSQHGARSLLDWKLNARELTAARKVLREDEQLVLVLRPQVEVDGSLYWMAIAFLCMSALVVSLAHMGSEHPLSFLAGVVLCVPGGCMMANRWRKIYSRRHAFYMLTRQRAIVMEAAIRGYRPCSYPLHEGMVESVAVRGDGTGNIVFGERKGWRIEYRRVLDDVKQLGFMDIAQVKCVQQVLEQTIRELGNAGK